MLTTNERKALQAIVDSEYQDGGDPIGHDVWTEYCNPFTNKRTQSGVYASLSKKGFIRVGFLEDVAGRNRMGTVCITEAGFKAMQSKLNLKEKSMQKATSIKSKKASASNLHAFRVILRGSKQKGKKEIRVRHVLTTKAPNEGAATEAAEKRADQLIKKEGLKNVYIAVLPPLSSAKAA